ncbi:unnamed protein product [Linum tenue]|uniref:Uncharacterized protein n=2 Tax=Malpighiales TaxID=3646 RepID=A0AAV0KMG1_9ROSI|nr:unnamed protein product [Linum tenue]
MKPKILISWQHSE